MVTIEELENNGFKLNIAQCMYPPHVKTIELGDNKLHISVAECELMTITIFYFTKHTQQKDTGKYFQKRQWFRLVNVPIYKDVQVLNLTSQQKFTLNISKWNIKELNKFTESII